MLDCSKGVFLTARLVLHCAVCPMSTPSYEMLVGACAAHGLDRNGTEDEVKRRLGDYLVAQLFATKPKSKRASSTSTPAPKRPATAWHAFLREEKERVKESGFHGRVAILKECARRWALAKRVNTSEAPLMLMSGEATSGKATSEASSSSEAASEADPVPDGLIEALKDLPAEEIIASLAAHGLPIESDHEANVAALARAMVA